MTYRDTVRTLTLTTALAGLTALPLAAQTLSEDTSVAAGAGTGVIAATDVAEAAADLDLNVDADVDTSNIGTSNLATTNLETDTTVTTPRVTGPLETAEFDRMNAAIDGGSAVAVSSDGTVVGTIDRVEQREDGTLRYSVALDDRFATATPRVILRSRTTLDADNRLNLGMSDARFGSSLSQFGSAGVGLN